MVIASRRERIYSQFPEPVSGYELNPEHGYFSVIIPEATTNLVTNPRKEGGSLTGYTALAGSITASDGWQAHSGYGIRALPAVATESGFYYDGVALTAGTTYTASITIQGEEGKTYFIYFASQAGALLGVKRKWIGTGHKQRIWITYPETASLTRRVYVTRYEAYNDQNVFYADGLQVEAKSYPTTYCDGDLKGFVLGEVAYQWNGTPQASTSTRSAQTRSGGREVNLLDLGIRVLAVLGLGMAPLVDQALPMPGRGELAQGTGTQAREFSLVSALYADGPGPRHLQALRSGLIDAFKPDLVTSDQPLILRYQACDDEGDPLGDSLDIICKYQNGLEGNWDNHQQERLALNFKMHLPWIQNTYTSAVNLGYQTTIANADYAAYRNTSGVWAAISTDFNSDVFVMITAPDGSVYIGGGFTNVGDANGDYIVKWTPTGGFTSLGTGVNGNVTALAFDAAGNLYLGGLFTSAGGVAGTARIAKWDGANFTSVGGGIASGQVLSLLVATDGKLYITGSFTNHGDANGDCITVWNGVSYASLSTGLNSNGNRLVETADGKILIVGGFTTAGGVTVNGVTIWNGITFTALGSGVAGLTAQPSSAAIDASNNIYIAGDFLTAGGISTPYIAKWNGFTWKALGSGMNAVVRDIMFDPKSNLLYAVGDFTTAGGTILPDSAAIWNGSVWMPMDINMPGAALVYCITTDLTGNLYIGYSTTGSAISATVTVPAVGSSTAYPIFYLTGQGTIWQIKNYITGKAVYFDLTLLAGERAILDLNPINPSFVSSFQGNIWSTILPGSNLNFPLMPGSNNISAYFFGSTTAATAIIMLWRDQYWSLDGAAWK